MSPEFVTLYGALPRAGPGTPDDVGFACDLAGLAPDARVLDAGCGPGADIPALLSHVPQGRVLAVDLLPDYVDHARSTHSGDPRVSVREMDMAAVGGPFELIWSAGALYFLGIAQGLRTLRAKLAPGGVIAFSHLVYLTDTPDPALRAMFDTEPDVMSAQALQDVIADTGFDCLGTRILPPEAWTAYYDPMRARITALRPGANAALAAVLDAAETEIGLRDRFAAQWGYVLSVVRPR